MFQVFFYSTTRGKRPDAISSPKIGHIVEWTFLNQGSSGRDGEQQILTNLNF